MRGKFPRGELGDGRQCNPGIAIDAVFKGHDQPVVQNTVEQDGPSLFGRDDLPEMSRYQAYQDYLAGRTIGETFNRAAAFLVLASRDVEQSAEEPAEADEASVPGE